MNIFFIRIVILLKFFYSISCNDLEIILFYNQPEVKSANQNMKGLSNGGASEVNTLQI